MLTRKSLTAMTSWETYLYGGDSDFRYDSREEFHNAHRPTNLVPVTRGDATAIHLTMPDGKTLIVSPEEAEKLSAEVSDV